MATLKLHRVTQTLLETCEVPLPHYRTIDVSDEHKYITHYRYAEMPGNRAGLVSLIEITESDHGFEIRRTSASNELKVEDFESYSRTAEKDLWKAFDTLTAVMEEIEPERSK